MRQNQNGRLERELESSVVGTMHELLETMERTVIEQSMRLEEALALAQRASRTKSEFLSTMSHEIRTPMNAVLGMAELLADTELGADQRNYLEILVANGSALMDLIGSILDLARIETGRLQLKQVPFDLTDLIELTISTFAVQAHRQGLELVARIAPEVPEYLVGDPQRLRQIIVNLVANAIKFTKRGAIVLEVTGAARPAELNNVCFSVSDTGIGIAKDQLDSIYSKFTQADSSISRKSRGAGIGLAIAKRLVDLMRGEITVGSQVGRGSKFSFTAPFGLPSSAATPVPSGTLDLFGHRVLVVDDHPVNRLMVRETMTHCRAEVTEAASGAEALRAIRKAVAMNKPYRFVLLDMRMPDAVGLELVKKIRQEQLPTAALIPMLYSDDIHEQVAQFKEHRLDTYLVKPITRRAMFRAIKRKLAGAKGVSPVDRLGKLVAESALAVEHKMRILVAEDSKDNRFLIEAYLRKEPCIITFVHDGLQAVEKATSNEYDLIFMDIQMPNKDGLAATRTIRKWECEHGHKPTPIFALTASALDEDVALSREAGCDAHLRKPVKKGVILEAVRSAAQRQPPEPRPLH